METKHRTKGFINAILSACTFALMPLFSVPIQNDIQTPSMLIYRFLFGSVFILIGMAYMHINLKITVGEMWRIGVLALLNDITALSQFYGFRFMESGSAITIFSIYPVFTCLLMVFFFKEKLDWRTALAIVLAVVGVAGVSGINLQGPYDMKLLIGVGLALIAGFSYAIYMVCVPVLKVGNMDSLKLTFYVFVFGMIFLLMLTPFMPTGIEMISSWKMAGVLLLLGLVPTAISNFALIVGLKNIGSTLTSILGDLEPPVAMAIGVIFLGENITWLRIGGLVLILLAVTIIILNKKESNNSKATIKG